MDALGRAKVLIKKANEVEELEGYLATVQEAHAMAAIAQAEQLKRIADALEVRAGLYHDPSGYGLDDDAMADARTDYADPLN